MIEFTAQIFRFSEKGDKTGWTYIEVPADIAERLNPGSKQTFRVKGRLDFYDIQGVALLPMGEGAFILPLNGKLRKGIGKNEGAMLNVALDLDRDFTIETPSELLEFFTEEPGAEAYFFGLAKSHRDYFSKWIDSAKTVETRMKRVVNTCNALVQKLSYGEMIRSLKNNR